MKVAAIIDAEGVLSHHYENCFICLFERQAGVWSRHTQVPLSLTEDINLNEIKRRLREAFAQLEHDGVCVLGSVRGILAVLLQDVGLRVWRAEGPLLGQLEKLACEESHSCSTDCGCATLALELEKTGEEHFKVNLALGLSSTGLNSRQLLIPVLETVKFKSLEVICDHQPRWFSSELSRLHLIVSSTKPVSDGKGECVVIEPVLKGST